MSPSPSPVGPTPTHTKAQPAKSLVAPPPPHQNAKPSLPSAKPNVNPRSLTSSPGPVHPSSKPPPPPPNNRGGQTHLGRNAISKSFNQTIGHGPQGRPQIPNYGNRISKVINRMIKQFITICHNDIV